MDLRQRPKQLFTGFTKAEVQKMGQLVKESKEQFLKKSFCKKLARDFNRSSCRAGKPIVKWIEIQNWVKNNQQQVMFEDTSSDAADVSLDLHQNDMTGNPKTPVPPGQDGDDLSRLEFEARSAKDGAWYDVDTFLSHSFLSSGELEVCVRYVGFGAGEDEWVNAKDSLRERSVALESSECGKLKVGDLVMCFQEREDQARYYDARVTAIQRRWHDIRGCRCLFLIRYEYDNSEERVRLRRLCCRPDTLTRPE